MTVYKFDFQSGYIQVLIWVISCGSSYCLCFCHSHSPSRGGAAGVRAPFENVMDFKRRNKERRPDSAQVDIVSTSTTDPCQHILDIK